VIAFLGFYFLVAFTLFLYGMHAYIMAFLFRRADRRTPPSMPRDYTPEVTIQLPIYNERYVVSRLIEAAAGLDYPREKLEIQVLDDSTDDTREHVAGIVEAWRRRGLDIVHIHRTDRVGYKAGALDEGLTVAKGEFVAVFDADFVPHAAFLRDTVGQFQDPGIGMVQTRWGHLNEDYSVLTRAQAVALDGHFLVEQTVRNRCGAFMNFNGTAGIWRKQCIRDAGGWEHDTLTEDLDLSYRAQLEGWNFLFLPDVVTPAELPVEVNGLKGQQFRWAKGSVQCAVKLFPRLARAGLSPFAKYQAFVHLTNHAVYPLLLLLGIMSLPALLVLDTFPEVSRSFAMATALAVASFGHPVMYFFSQRRAGRGRWESLILIPTVLAGGMGIAVNNTRAFLEGISGKPSAFIRTPKYAILSRRDSWVGKRYRVSLSPWAFPEILLAGYAAITLVYAFTHQHYLVIPFLALYFTGGMYIWSLSVAHALGNPRRASAPAPASAPASVPASTSALAPVHGE